MLPPFHLWEREFEWTISKVFHRKSPWCWERLKAGGEGDNREWGGWMASQTPWAWVWANSRRQWRTGEPDVLQSMGLLRARHDSKWTTATMIKCCDGRAYTALAGDPCTPELSSTLQDVLCGCSEKELLLPESTWLPLYSIASTGQWPALVAIDFSRRRKTSAVYKRYSLWQGAENHWGFCKWGCWVVSRCLPQPNDLLQFASFLTGIQIMVLSKATNDHMSGTLRIGKNRKHHCWLLKSMRDPCYFFSVTWHPGDFLNLPER